MERNTASMAGQHIVAPGKASAEQVLSQLRLEARTDGQIEHPSKNALFARLYFFTTRAWVDYAKSHGDPELLYLVVKHFHGLYSRYVLEIDLLENAETVSHWRVYRKLVGHEKAAHNIISQLTALIMGIRAHTRYDLAEAICFAHEKYQQRHGHSPDSDHFHSLLFGKKSDKVFRTASIDFVSSLVGPCGNFSAMKRVVKTISLLWLPIFQMARKMAWREARRSISSGATIRRRNGSSNCGSPA